MTFNYWPDEKILQFIKLIKEEPSLWDRSNPYYNSKQERDESWSLISKRIGETDVSLLKSKLKSFRSNYRGECRKIESNPDYKPVWRFYKLLRFLDYLPTEDEGDTEDDETENQQKNNRKVTFHRWSDEKTKECIRLFSLEPVLWNKCHQDYGDVNRRSKAMENIAAKINCSVNVLKMKIKSLRSNFLSERKKMLKNKNYEPVWRFYSCLDFLDTVQDDINYENQENAALDEININRAVETAKTEQFWSETKVLEFIDLLKISPQLWKKSHPDHANRKQKEIIWTNIGKEINTSASNAEMKYKILRRQFRRQYMKSLNNKLYRPEWKYFKALKFLSCQSEDLNEFTTNVEYLEEDFLWDNTQSSSFEDNETEIGNDSDYYIEDLIVSNDCEYNSNVDDNDCEFDSNDENSQNFDTKLVFWSDETTLKFINLLREQPTLWNKNLKNFCKKNKRSEIFEQLALEMNSTLAIVRSKYKHLTRNFRVEHQKLVKHPEYKPSWTFFRSLKFLAGNAFEQDDESESQGVSNRVLRHWDDEKTIKFLYLLKKNPLIYDKSSKRSNAFEKDKIWQNIANELDDTVDLLRRKYKSLRRMCSIECLRKKREPNYKHTWRFLPYARFLCNDINDCESFGNDMFDSVDSSSGTPIQQVQWSDQQIIDFISVLQKYPTIWNHKSPNYKSGTARIQAFQKISKALDIPEDVLKIKYNILRGQYFKEFKRTTFDVDYTPSWKFYSFMKFITIDETVTDISNDESTRDNDNFPESESCSVLDYSSGNDQSNIVALDERTAVGEEMIANDLQTIQEIVFKDTESVNKTVNVTSRREDNQIKDEYTAFAEYVANEMRKMRGHRLIELSFKSKIIRAVLEANEALSQES